jgi:hypothetical protein
MVERLTKHPYSDARNTVVAALALWTLAIGLAAASGALERMGSSLAASLLVFMSGIAVAATTMDRRIGAWIASWGPVERLAGSGASRWLAAAAAIVLPFAVARAAQDLARGSPAGFSALLLVAVPMLAGLAGALAVSWMRGSGARTGLAPFAGSLAASRRSR